MSEVLLPQPGGFEGLLAVEEAHHPSRLAIPPLGHAPEGRLGLGSACLATGAEPTDRNESIAEVTDFREFQADVGERLVDVSDPLADALVSPVHRRLTLEHCLKRPVQLHLGVDSLPRTRRYPGGCMRQSPA